VLCNLSEAEHTHPRLQSNQKDIELPVEPGSRSTPERFVPRTPHEDQSLLSVAEMGTLSQEVADDVGILQEFFRNRDQLMAGLFGSKLRRSPTRDELIRQIVLQFAQGSRRNIAFYAHACSYLATEPSVRSELELLAHKGLVRFIDEPANKRSKVVAPTKRLIQFYNVQMPRLRTEVLALLRKFGTVPGV